MEEKCPYVREKMGTNFLDSPNSMDFAALSRATGNWWGNPCISHIIKYTIECESNGKKAPILWEKYEYQFPRFSSYDGFCRIFLEIDFSGFSHSMGCPAIFHTLGNWQENPIISHVMKYTIGRESNGKKHPYCEKSMSINFPDPPHAMSFLGYSWEPIFQTFPIRWVWLSFPILWELMRKHIHFPCDEV